MALAKADTFIGFKQQTVSRWRTCHTELSQQNVTTPVYIPTAPRESNAALPHTRSSITVRQRKRVSVSSTPFHPARHNKSGTVPPSQHNAAHSR